MLSFNIQLARGRVQSSDWAARLSIRIKRVLEISLFLILVFVRLIKILSFKIRSPVWGV